MTDRQTVGLDDEALEEIRQKWRYVCGYCDAGLMTACRCPDEDPRNVIHALLGEVDRLRVVETASIGAHALLDDAEAEVSRLRAAVDRVRALHRPVDVERYEHFNCGPDGTCEHDECPTETVQMCFYCVCGGWYDDPEGHGYMPDGQLDRAMWPCETVRALDGEAVDQ